jgi:D-xylose reductase
MFESIPLSSGAHLPSVGFGFWKVDRPVAPEVTRQAIQAGYRHLDCACDYGNEAEVGQGIQQAIADTLCTREDLWVTSKLWNTYHAAEHVRPACEKTLRDLGLKQLDLYLIHFPIAQKFVPFDTRYPPGWLFDPSTENPRMEEVRIPISETWRAMERLVDDGLVRHIGICNFGTSLLRDLLSYAKIRPSVLQVESHPFLVQSRLLRYCQQEQIAFTAFSPLGAASYYSLGMASKSESLLDNPIVQCIGLEKGKSAAQILLRWGIQRGTSVIPKTSNHERMAENLNLFDFELSEADMNSLSGLDRGRRFNDPGVFCEAAFNTFCPIYE